MSRITLKEKAYQQLREKILSGALGQGENLTEQSLVQLLGMSRTPIRAAMEKLESEGLVQYTPNKGMTIVEMSLKRAVDIFDYRAILEPHIVSALAKRGLTAEQSLWLEQNLQEQEKTVEARDFYQFTVLDSELHMYLATCHGNQEIIYTMDRLQDQLFQLALRVLSKDSARITDSYRDHQMIVSLIQEANEKEVHERMIDHLIYGKQILVL